MTSVRRSRESVVRRAFRASSSDLSLRVVRGASFAAVGMIVRIGITLMSMAILARLLSPADFGHVVMANVVTELAFVFSSFGLGEIIIQRKRLTRLQLDTVWWTSLAIGAVLTVLVACASFLSDALFANPVSGELLRVLCLVFLLDQLTVVPNSLLSRLLMFRQLFVVQIVMLVSRAASAIALALWGAGVWSLVWAAVIASLVQLLVCTWLAGFRPRWRFTAAFLMSTWRTNGSYFASGLLFYLSMNMDLAMVGRSLGAASLGYFQAARGLADDISARIAVPLQRVLFPAFSSIQDDMVRFRFGVIRSGRLLALVTIPVGFGIAAVAEELVNILYGAQWLPMIALLEIIAPAAGLRAATTVSRPVFQAMNRVELSLKLSLASTLLLAFLLIAASPWGLQGFALAYAANSLFMLVILAVSARLVGIGIRELCGALAPPLVAAMLMYAAVIAMRWQIEAADLGAGWRFVVFTLTGIFVYCLGISLIARRHLGDVRDVISRILAK